MNRSVLFVDDDPNILAAFRRQFRREITMEAATGARDGLQLLEQWSPFAVVVADLRMPEINGIEFLEIVKHNYPNTVRIMLSGNADLEDAIHAVNDGNIFRFLTKPCPPEILRKAVEDGIAQYQLITAERELLEKTLSGSVKVLTDVLSMLNPEAFSRASRVRLIVRSMASRLNCQDAWQYELAAMLSQIGCVTLPPELLEKIYQNEALSPEEEKLYHSHPRIGAQLIGNIPRLEPIARMIAAQHETPENQSEDAQSDSKAAGIERGAHMLRIALDFDQLLHSGLSFRDALSRMHTRGARYDPELLATLKILPVFHARTGQGPGLGHRHRGWEVACLASLCEEML